MQTIQIQWHTVGERGYKRIAIGVDRLSKCGRFAVHESPGHDWLNGWKVSHVPTGSFILATKHKRDAIKAMKEISAINGPWSSRSIKKLQQELTDLVRPIVLRYDQRYANLSAISTSKSAK